MSCNILYHDRGLFMKPIKSLVAFLIVLAMCFAFTSCKKKADVPVAEDAVETELQLEDEGKDLENSEEKI